MAAPLSPADRSRLEKYAGMLGSVHDGERLNALGFIQKLANTYKIPIHELLLGAGGGAGQSSNNYDRMRAEQAERRAREAELRAQQAEQAARQTRPAEPDPDTPKLPFDWRERFARAQERNQSRYFLTSWEANFVTDLIARGTRCPSPKQTVVIIRILEKAHTFSTASADADWEDVP